MNRLPLSRMSRAMLITLVGLLALPACSDDDEETPNIPDAGPRPDAGTDGGSDAGPDGGEPEPDGGSDAGTWVTEFSCEGKPQATLTFSPGQEQDLQNAVNDLAPCTSIKLGAGTFHFDNAVTIRQDGITISGAGRGAQGEATGGSASTVLDFSNATANTNGLDVVGKLFTVRDVALWNAQKDALRVENSANVYIQRIRTEWALENTESNGKYGIYPVKSRYVVIEDSEAYNAADAGIYVGQTRYAIVRRNIAKKNVAGIEIENTKYAYVEGNTATDNTTGLVVFDLPGNPIKGTDILIVDNIITGNNRPNFASVTASSSTVSQVPAGTGTFILASRRVEFTGNTWGKNNTVDIAVLSGLAIEDDVALWSAGFFNFASADVYIHGNTFQGESGIAVDNGNTDPQRRPLGALVGGVYQYARVAAEIEHVEHVLWDGMDPLPPAAAETTSHNKLNLCFTGNTLPEPNVAAVVDFDLANVATHLQAGPQNVAAAFGETRRFKQGEAPFNCAGFTPALSLPQP
ncbi:right-handed parallel beta-helix repeat-containing protein [Myxococcus sp. K15C18031901]|uniref:parallel beta-helix domain-containing protein n=1 Tax=Myxococcus dinghuensis TaxID=2906761 RepID=UPI0020A6EDCD|nr:parallel beta-helix domain-containing protein [Myxococcus dinghuensis]MCP3102711.1 right-handed parallel beta-helix repeat-containing protein [Myxococcus dinghuensis]